MLAKKPKQWKSGLRSSARTQRKEWCQETAREQCNTLKALTKTQQAYVSSTVAEDTVGTSWRKTAVIQTLVYSHSKKTPSQEAESLPVLTKEVEEAV